MNKKSLAFLMLALMAVSGSFFLSSCKSTKSITRLHLKELPFETLYQRMEAQAPSFSWFAGKLAVNYQKGDKEPVNFRVQVRMKKDSILWMSLVPAMGIEAARVVMTEDSVKLLNRIKKNYVLGTYRLIDSLMHTHINFAMIQALLFADGVHYPVIDSSATVMQNQYLLHMKMKVPGVDDAARFLDQKVWLDPHTFRIKSLQLSESSMKNKAIRIFYEEYQTVSGSTLPLKIKIIIAANQTIVINIIYKKTEINVRHGFPFIIPSKYQKMI